MARKSNTQGSNGALVIEGLAETNRKAELAAKLASLQKSQKSKAGEEKRNAERQARLVDLANGTNESGKNPKLRQNDALRPETLRPSTEGELIGGKPAKGWVVEIVCEICGEARLINTQDAFQVRFCEAHVGEARKAAGKARRDAKKVEALEKLSEEELLAEIAKLEAVAA